MRKNWTNMRPDAFSPVVAWSTKYWNSVWKTVGAMVPTQYGRTTGASTKAGRNQAIAGKTQGHPQVVVWPILFCKNKLKLTDLFTKLGKFFTRISFTMSGSPTRSCGCRIPQVLLKIPTDSHVWNHSNPIQENSLWNEKWTRWKVNRSCICTKVTK